MQKVFSQTLEIKKLTNEIRQLVGAYGVPYTRENFEFNELGGIFEPKAIVKILEKNTIVYPNNTLGFMFEEINVFDQHQYFYILENSVNKFIENLQKIALEDTEENFLNSLKNLLKTEVVFVAEGENNEVVIP